MRVGPGGLCFFLPALCLKKIIMKWEKTKLYWRNRQYDATIEGPCEMGCYRVWVKREYKICDSLKDAKEWVEFITIPNTSL